jgi:hypothetical protein
MKGYHFPMETVIGVLVLVFIWRFLVHAKREFQWFEPRFPEKTPSEIWEWGQSQWALAKQWDSPTQLSQRKAEIEAGMNARLARLGYHGHLTLDGPEPEQIRPSLGQQWRWMKDK